MSSFIRTLRHTLVIDTSIRGVLRDNRWVTLPTQEWKFLLRISRSGKVRRLVTR